jgi:GntP family gluconate:H+ symporter
VFALLAAVLLAMVTFGTAVGFSPAVLGKKIGASLMPVVGVMLIVGAGGGFKQALVDGGTGAAIAKIALAAGLSTLLLGWIVAVLIRLATGSATVATVTAAGIVAPLAAGLRRRSCRWWCCRSARARCSSRTSTTPGSGWSRSTSA